MKFRHKLISGTKRIIIEKRWWGFWPRYYKDGRDHINSMKTEHVELLNKIAMLEASIDLAEKQYKQSVKNMEKSPNRDRQGNPITGWKHRKEGKWWQPAILFWAKSIVPEPPAFDRKMYVLGQGGGQARQRPREVEVTMEEHRKAYDDVGKNGENLFFYSPGKPQGKDKNWKNRRKGESDQEYKDRMKKGPQHSADGEIKP